VNACLPGGDWQTWCVLIIMFAVQFISWVKWDVVDRTAFDMWLAHLLFGYANHFMLLRFKLTIAQAITQ